MRLHIYSNKTNRLAAIIEHVAHFEEHSTFYIVHTRGEKWFEQTLIDKHEYTVYTEQ